ncbi:MAG: spherulation-specific family 4 protein [Terracidiphilus sp.]
MLLQFGRTLAVAQTRLAIPSYVSPTSAGWNRWESLGSRIVGIMILNRNNGDDTQIEPESVAAIKKTQASGILVLGYIHTGYAKRDPHEVEAKIDGVYASYHVDGIFLDETPTDCAAIGTNRVTNLEYYQVLSKYIRTKSGKHLVVLNPGTVPGSDCWMSVADILVTFEQATFANYQDSYTDAPWMHSFGPERFWNLVYSVPTAQQMQQIVELAHKRGVGWLYVTDDGPDGNPWDTPATYLSDEAQLWTGVAPPVVPVPRRVSIQWSGLKGSRAQVLMDSGQKGGARYRGATPDLAADLMLEVPGDGSVRLMRYAGNGQDWKWNVEAANPFLSQPQPGTNRIEFDAAPLGSAENVKIQFRLLDKDWNAISASKVLNWKPS